MCSSPPTERVIVQVHVRSEVVRVLGGVVGWGRVCVLVCMCVCVFCVCVCVCVCLCVCMCGCWRGRVAHAHVSGCSRCTLAAAPRALGMHQAGVWCAPVCAVRCACMRSCRRCVFAAALRAPGMHQALSSCSRVGASLPLRTRINDCLQEAHPCHDNHTYRTYHTYRKS